MTEILENGMEVHFTGSNHNQMGVNKLIFDIENTIANHQADTLGEWMLIRKGLEILLEKTDEEIEKYLSE